jgi:DNA polymerase-4
VEAKRWGIKTGTPVWEAQKLYPDIILTPTHPDRYRFYTAKFLNVLYDYSDKVEKYSIDEAFVDLTRSCNIIRLGKSGLWEPVDPFVEAEAIAKEIKRRVTLEVGDWLRVSVGIAWNKLVAKIGSDLEKPNGLVVLRPTDKERLYNTLALTDVPGIARRQEKNLNALGIMTLRDLQQYPQAALVAHFGIPGYHLHSMGQLEGSWKEGFDDADPIKSMGHMYTVSREHRRSGVAIPVLYKLSEMVGARLRANGLMGSVVHAFVHTAQDTWVGKRMTLGCFINDGREIFLHSRAILETLCNVSLAMLSPRLIGVTVSGLAAPMGQGSLFPRDKKQQQVVGALDRINEKYGDFTVARVPAFLARDIIRDSVGFGRMKEFKTIGNFKRG